MPNPWRYPPAVPDHALELSFEPDSTAAVMAQWEALKAARLPSQADHRSMTNAPHLTVVAAVGIDASVISLARDAVAPLLPTRIELRGVVLFGQGPRATIAHLVEPEAALAAAAARLRALVPAALEVLQATAAPRELVCDRLRWWDPDQGLIEDIAVARDS